MAKAGPAGRRPPTTSLARAPLRLPRGPSRIIGATPPPASAQEPCRSAAHVVGTTATSAPPNNGLEVPTTDTAADGLRTMATSAPPSNGLEVPAAAAPSDGTSAADDASADAAANDNDDRNGGGGCGSGAALGSGRWLLAAGVEELTGSTPSDDEPKPACAACAACAVRATAAVTSALPSWPATKPSRIPSLSRERPTAPQSSA
mmetsp:Transcript_51090/g.163981  ORF Transcript_51090/g.163981 Transcript_51090/m.163981 type:complete len:204 (-) Transcript_51090:713-1324(-)